MNRQPTKRQQILKRVFIYGIMCLAVVALLVALVFIMLGYQFNRNDGKIEQGGLVQFDSQPTGANVTIDGATLGSQTTSKTTMSAGQHYVTMERSGYKSWQKSVTVEPGSILWLNYARLIPNDLKPANVSQFGALSSTVASPDDKWMAIKEDAANGTVKLADLSADTVKTKNLELPPSSFTAPSAGKSQQFSLEKWDPDSRFVLVKHTYDDTKIEWLVVDTENVNETKNVTKLLNVDISKIEFDRGNSAILYAQTGTDVRKIDLGAATLSKPLVSNVADFSLYDQSTITFTTLLNPETGARSVGYYEKDAENPYTIRTFTDNGQAPLKLSIGKYFNDTFMAIAYGESLEVLKGGLPKTEKEIKALKSFATVPLPGGAQYLSIKTNGRFVVAQNAATYHMYDIELKKATITTLKGASEFTRELPWLDNYILWSDRDNMLRLYEFDGANQHDIMAVQSGQSVSLSPNSKYLYGFTKENDTSYHLTRVQMLPQ